MSAPIRTALVTGASRGIGQAIALRLAREGFAVVVNYTDQGQRAEQTVGQIRALGGRAIALAADVADTDEVDRLFRQAIAAFGTPGVIVHSAGIKRLAEVDDGHSGILDEVLAVNVRGAFNVMGRAARELTEHGRLIVLSCSAVALAQPGYGPYVASKAAVEALVRVAASELRGRSITVNAVAPGRTASDLFHDGHSPEQIEYHRRLPPLERLGTPEDIAGAVAFLAGPDGARINGQVLRGHGALA